jgi:hypothetical protein
LTRHKSFLSIRGSRLVSGAQAASFSRALALIIAAPFSAIMIAGALGIRRADRRHHRGVDDPSASSPWTRSWWSTTAMP